MKRTLLLSLTLAMAAFPAEWTGYISDAACGKANANDSAESKECARRCVKSGSAPVFVVGDKVLSIADPKKVTGFVGEKVTVTGTVDDAKKSVTVATIKKAS